MYEGPNDLTKLANGRIGKNGETRVKIRSLQITTQVDTGTPSGKKYETIPICQAKGLAESSCPIFLTKGAKRCSVG